MCGISVVAALNQKGILQGGSPSDGGASNGTAHRAPPSAASVSGESSDRTGNDLTNGTVTRANEFEDQLAKSLELISHRGPDASGQWISPDGRAALGFTRLSIIDLSDRGNQPFHNPEGTVHAVVNGELYDSDRIRDELKQDIGYKFTSESDSEIAVALYEKHGISFVNYLRGEYSVCLYDSRTQNLYAVRDRFGIKPLLYTVVGDRLLIASEAKAFLPLGWKPKWDVRSLVEEGWWHDERSSFQGVTKIPPSHYLICDSKGKIETKRYWEVDYPDKSVVENRSKEEIIEGVRSRLIEAIRLRLRADVPVGVYLSGGIDSSAVAGIMCYLAREREKSLGTEKDPQELICYGIAFDPESGMDESDIAQRTADHLGLKLIKKSMSEAEIAKRFEDATWHCEQQNFDLNYVGKFALSEAPNDLGHKVVLTGEGSDEIFGGYLFLLPDFLRERDGAWPQSGFSEDSRMGAYKRIDAEANARFESQGFTMTEDQKEPGQHPLDKIRSKDTITGLKIPYWAEWTRSSLNNADPVSALKSRVNSSLGDRIANKWHPLNSGLHVMANAMQGMILSTLGDRSEMSHSIEARLPFLDHELVQYAADIPPSLKIKPQPDGTFTEKWVLREAVKPFVTDEIYRRMKHPYMAPTTFPVGGPLHQLLQRLLTEENVARLGFVDWNKARTLSERAFEGRDAAALRHAIILAQYIVLAQKFGVETATPSNVSGDVEQGAGVA